MNTCNKFRQNAVVAMMAVVGLAGCSTNDNAPDSHIDYKSTAAVKTQRLDVPPDLTQLQRDNRYALPQQRGVATASGYEAQVASDKKAASAEGGVVPKNTSSLHFERDGTQRWIVTTESPEVVWPKLKAFWQEMGFNLTIDSPSSGIMETDWAENRAKIPQDLIRRTIGKIFDSLYSTGERDKFRTRLERGPKGTTEIYLSHRGAEEVLQGREKETTVWTARAADPELEAEFLQRMMVRLGKSADEAKAEIAKGGTPVAAATAERAKLDKSAGQVSVVVDEAFDRAWRRVGLALDRVGFTVEDRDRANGLYYVRYVDQSEPQKTGWFGSKKEREPVRYHISVKGEGSNSRVKVLDEQNKEAPATASENILSLLNDQLK